MRSNNLRICDVDPKSWDKIIQEHDGSFYHLFSWSKIYQKEFGFKTNYLSFHHKNKSQSVIPFVRRGKLFPKWVSLPYADYGGIVGDASDSILENLKSRLGKFQIYTTTIPNSKNSAVPVYEVFEMIVPEAYEECFSNYYHHKTRNVVKKAYKNGVITKIVSPNDEVINQFYNLYLLTMKKIGTLAQSKNYFQAVAQEFDKFIFISEAIINNQVSGFVWCFKFNKKVYIWANATNESDLGLGINYAAYDAAIQEAFRLKSEKIVFGASDPESSQAFFKKRWGAIGRPIYLLESPENTVKTNKISNIFMRNILRQMPLTLYKSVSRLAVYLF